MKFAIKHEIKGRIRIHLAQKHMTYRQADILQCYLEKEANISKASVYVRTQDVAVVYTGSRDGLIRLLSRFSYETAQVSESALENSGRELNETYKEKLINSVVMRTLNKMFLPYPVRVAITTVKSVKYIYHGVRTLMKGKLEVPVLDAAAIGVSMLRGYLYWMQQQSVYLCSAVTSILQVPPCSCLESVRSLRNGHIRNPSMTLQEACLSMQRKYGL